MAVASLIFEGPALIGRSLVHVGIATVLGVAFIVYLSTLVAYSLWSWLLARHSASAVTPFALLIPVVGMLASTLMLGESLPAWKLQAAALVIAGLVLNVVGSRMGRMAPIAR